MRPHIRAACLMLPPSRSALSNVPRVCSSLRPIACLANCSARPGSTLASFGVSSLWLPCFCSLNAPVFVVEFQHNRPMAVCSWGSNNVRPSCVGQFADIAGDGARGLAFRQGIPVSAAHIRAHRCGIFHRVHIASCSGADPAPGARFARAYDTFVRGFRANITGRLRFRVLAAALSSPRSLFVL